MPITLLETEKAYSQQLKGNFTLTLLNSKFELNKTTLAKALLELNVKVSSVQAINPYIKVKKKNLKKGGIRVVSLKRPKKFIVTLANGQKIDENKITELQKLLISKLENETQRAQNANQTTQNSNQTN